MDITFDPPKRAKPLVERGLDFDEAKLVFAGDFLSLEDDRKDYGERRVITIGFLRGRMVAVGWTEREGKRHVFTMRKCNAREQRKYKRVFEGGSDDG